MSCQGDDHRRTRSVQGPLLGPGQGLAGQGQDGGEHDCGPVPCVDPIQAGPVVARGERESEDGGDNDD